MVHFTFFEIHLDDATFEANAPFASKGDETAADDEEASTDVDRADAGSEAGPPKVVPLVVGLVFMVVVAAVIRKIRNRGGDGESIEASVSEELEVEAP